MIPARPITVTLPRVLFKLKTHLITTTTTTTCAPPSPHLHLRRCLPPSPAMPPDHGGDADLAADELQSLSFGSSERSRSGSTVSTATTVSTTTSGPPPPPPPPPPRAAAAPRLGAVSLSDIRFVRRLGSGDIGSVYLAEVKGARGGGAAVVAAKVMDRKELAGRNKEGRARTEREILEAVDHPFLPRLYGVAEGDRWSCLLTEFCPGGDLHVLRQRQPHRRFTESAVRYNTVVHYISSIRLLDRTNTLFS